MIEPIEVQNMLEGMGVTSPNMPALAAEVTNAMLEANQTAPTEGFIRDYLLGLPGAPDEEGLDEDYELSDDEDDE